MGLFSRSKKKKAEAQKLRQSSAPAVAFDGDVLHATNNAHVGLDSLIVVASGVDQPEGRSLSLGAREFE